MRSSIFLALVLLAAPGCGGGSGAAEVDRATAGGTTTPGMPDQARRSSSFQSLPSTAGGLPDNGRSADYRPGYARGAAEAVEQIEKGTATVYVYGMRESSDLLDRDTGLNVTAIAYCITSDGIHGRADGHNETLDRLILERGMPSYSRRRWERELYDLGGYLAGLTGSDAPVPLYIGGRGIALRGGRMVVSMLPDLRVYMDGAPMIWSDAGGGRRSAVSVPWSSVLRSIEVADGPAGSDVLVFRSTFADGSIEREALDLRIGDWLRRESVTPGSPVGQHKTGP